VLLAEVAGIEGAPFEPDPAQTTQARRMQAPVDVQLIRQWILDPEVLKGRREVRERAIRPIRLLIPGVVELGDVIGVDDLQVTRHFLARRLIQAGHDLIEQQLHAFVSRQRILFGPLSVKETDSRGKEKTPGRCRASATLHATPQPSQSPRPPAPRLGSG